jgi:hypothetical protein
VINKRLIAIDQMQFVNPDRVISAKIEIHSDNYNPFRLAFQMDDGSEVITQAKSQHDIDKIVNQFYYSDEIQVIPRFLS